MSTSQVSIQYQGFHPSDFVKSFVESLVAEIGNEAPSGSTIRATFNRKDKLFKGMINIRSSAGPFFIAVRNSSLKSVMESLLGQTRRRLSKWKSKRFEHMSIRKMGRQVFGDIDKLDPS